MQIELTHPFARDTSWPAFRATAYGSDAFQQRLVPLARRWQRYRTLQAVPRVLTFGFGVALLLAVGVSVLGLPNLVVGLALSAALAPLIPLAARSLVAPSPLAAALAYDRRLGMFERLSTAVAGSQADSHMQDLQRRDALRALANVNAAFAFPYRVSRGNLGILAVAAAALAAGLLASTADLLPRVGERVPASALAASAGAAVDGSAPALVDPAALARVDEIRAAMAELEQQRDPDAAPAALAAEAAGEALRRTSEGRRLGRLLDSGDFQAAAAEARELGGQLAEMNSTRMDELAQGLRQASDRAAGFDPGLAEQLRAAAAALDRGQLADARSALERLAEEIETVGGTIETDRGLEAQLDQLARQLAEAEGAAQGTMPGSESDSLGAAVAGAAEAAAPADAGAETGDGMTGGGDSAASGRALEGTLETLAPEQRLSVDGQLEIVEIKPTEEGTELVEQPVLELGPGGSSGFEASAGDRGFAVGRQDVARNVPLDMLPMMDRYFAAP